MTLVLDGAKRVFGRAERSAKNTAIGATIFGSAGIRVAFGAATGATTGLMRSIVSRLYNFVERCLHKRGYEPAGWIKPQVRPGRPERWNTRDSRALIAIHCRPGYTALMVCRSEELLARLSSLSIEHKTIEHPAVFTVEEAQAHTAHLPGGHCKNLFLKDKKRGLWLLVCLDHRRIDMNRLSKVLGCPRLSFGKPDLLLEVLGVTPGSVTPFALINDRDHRVQPLLDKAMLSHGVLNYHPLTNEATTTIKSVDLPTFINAMGHQPRTLDLEENGVDKT